VNFPTTARTPSGRKAQLGALLRHLREQVQLTQQDAGRAVWAKSSDGSVQNKIARLESADTGIGDDDLRALLKVYGMADGPITELALDLQTGTSQRGRWHGPRATYTDSDRRYVDLEEDAQRIRLVATERVPELLQCESYTRARTTPAADSPAAQATIDRQRGVLFRPNPPQFYALLSESCIRRVQGDRAVMREQIAHLITMSEYPHVVIQLVPFDPGRNPRAQRLAIADSGILERFALLRLDAPGVLDTFPRYLDYAFSRSGKDLTWSDNVQHYEEIWGQGNAAALSRTATRTFLHDAAGDFL
jgi:hypothetical protein